MPALTNFEPKDAEKIISMTLKIGVWVAAAEDEQGGIDDNRERGALLAALKSIGRDKNRTPVVREIAAQALAHQAKWKGWHAADTFIMPDPVPVVKIIRDHAGPEEAKAYSRMLYDLAESVALAYGEFGLLDDQAEDNGAIGNFFDKCIHRMRSDTQKGAPQNVSPAEQDSLNRLYDVLKLGY